jgi:hypothetical protein
MWSAEELRAFLEATAEDRLAVMWVLFATTGMRRSELLGMPWRAVDLDASPGAACGSPDRRGGGQAARGGRGQDRQQPPAACPRPALRAHRVQAAPGAAGLGVGVGRHRPGVHPRGRPGPAPRARHQAVRAPGPRRRTAADHPARGPTQLLRCGAGCWRAAQVRVRAARARQHLDHCQPLPARAAVDGRAHRQCRRQPDPRQPHRGRGVRCQSAVNGTAGP